jgi:hypothetical protein
MLSRSSNIVELNNESSPSNGVELVQMAVRGGGTWCSSMGDDTGNIGKRLKLAGQSGGKEQWRALMLLREKA